jgi:PAS domain S-box-containing protein
MRSVPASIAALPRPRPKASIMAAYVLCPVFLLISVYGFWQWSMLSIGAHLPPDQFYYLIGLIVVPVALSLFLAVRAAQRLEYARLSGGYQVRLDNLQKRLNAQEDLLHSVTDQNPGAISIFDKNNNYWFVNLHAAQKHGSDPNDIIGKPLSKVVGHEHARKHEARINAVRASGEAIDALDQINSEKGKIQFIQARYISIGSFGDFSGGVMVREEDVTSLILERERRETMLRQVIATLVAVVDRRDPYASGHSQRVGQLSRILAEELTLSEKEIETSEVSGSLMNFGKVLVSRQILTKTSALTPEELQRVRDSILTSADILSLIDFVGPVVPTLRQVLERWDGTGTPQGLKGEDILVTARIVMVANTFVALVSPRAHRPSLEFKDALQRITVDAGKVYDPRVVTALSNYIQSRADKLGWLSVSGKVA